MESKFNTKEINEKLMKFCGIEYKKSETIFGDKLVAYSSGYYWRGKFIRKTCPDLVHDYDVQRKYLHKELSRRGIYFQYNSEISKAVIYTNKIGVSLFFDRIDKEFTVAFALAVEKLIDEVKKK